MDYITEILHLIILRIHVGLAIVAIAVLVPDDRIPASKPKRHGSHILSC